MSPSRVFVELNHVVRAGMITCPGLPAPAITPHLTRDQSPSVYAPALVLRIAGGSGRAVDVPALAELGEVRGCAVLINSGDDARFGTPAYAQDPSFLTRAGARFTAVPPRVADFGTFPVRAFATVDRSRIERELTSTNGGS